MEKMIDALKTLFNGIILLFCDQRGEVNAEADENDQNKKVDDDQENNAQTDENQNDGANQDENQDENQIDTSQFGGYGTIDELVQAHETMKGQTGATEKNLREMRQALKRHGIVFDRESGDLAVIPGSDEKNKRPARQSKFTDQHKNDFNFFFGTAEDDQQNVVSSRDKFLNLLDVLIEDRFDGMMENFQRSTAQKMQQARSWNDEYKKSTNEMFATYPQLVESVNGKANDSFDKTFYDGVMNYLNDNPKLRQQPDGEFIAADRVARQMRINPIQLGLERQKGFQQGKKQKKIVGDAGGSQGTGGNKTGFKRLSKDEYLALSPQDKDEYNRKLLAL